MIWRSELSISEPTQDTVTFFHTKLPRNTELKPKHTYAIPVFPREGFPTAWGIKRC